MGVVNGVELCGVVNGVELCGLVYIEHLLRVSVARPQPVQDDVLKGHPNTFQGLDKYVNM